MPPHRPPLSAASPRLFAMVVALLVAAYALGGAAPALGASAEPFEAVRSSSPQQAPDPVGVWPLAPAPEVPEVIAGFDPPSTQWGSGHRGVDLLGSLGQTVRSALPGVVSFAGVLAGRGVVVVDHGATRTTYEPVAATQRVGDPVAAGEAIGTLQSGGSHCFPRVCLHWGWIEGETYLDPLRLVGMGPVRLLPLWRDEPVQAGTSGSTWLRLALPYAAWRPLLRLLRTGSYVT